MVKAGLGLFCFCFFLRHVFHLLFPPPAFLLPAPTSIVHLSGVGEMFVVDGFCKD